MKDLFPPAAVRSVADLRILAQEFRHEQGRISLDEDALLRKRREQGLRLIRMQASGQVPEGEWIAWVEKNLDVKKRQCQRYMAFARGPGENLKAEWQKASVSKTPPQSSQDAPGTTQKEDGPDDDEKPVSVPDDVPEHVRVHMRERQKFTTALHRVRHAKKALEEVQASPTYPLVKAGLTVSLTDRIESIERQLDRRVPQEVCEDCKGQTSTCPSCGGKGFLARDEVEK